MSFRISHTLRISREGSGAAEASPRLRRFALSIVTLALTGWPAAASAQTDYYNTDARRPVRIEDAYPVERYAFELQVAPLRLERSDRGSYHWEFEPELAYGILPGTHLEIGVPLLFADGAGGNSEFGLGGIAISAFHNLNVETTSLPAFALAADVRVPVGSFAPDALYPSLKGIATRTYGFARFHVNAQYTFGSTPDPLEQTGEASRWMAGVAVDRAFPLRAALLIADVYVEQPLHDGADPEWTIEAGTRYQLDPYFALDAGIGRRISGPHKGWFVTLGLARAFAIRSLIAVPGH